MDTQTQYQLAQYVSFALVAVGLLSIGIGVGYYLSVQSLLGPACAGGINQSVTACEETAQGLSDNANIALVVGLGSVALGRGLLWYLQNKLP